MQPEDHYVDINRQSWNDRTAVHTQSSFYNMDAFLNGQTSLKEIELALLGNIAGKKILHLQCHFGQDSLSLARMGAHVTGADLSDKAIAYARKLALETGQDARFICSDLYSLPDVLQETFDIVYTSYGVLGWLPDMDRWADIVAQYLRPGGRLLLVEFHPLVWMFDDDFQRVAYNYFKSAAIVETEAGTYADRSADIQPQSVTWNHSLSEVISALLGRDLALKTFREFDYSPYNCFRGTVESTPGKFHINHLANNIPMVYAIQALKPA